MIQTLLIRFANWIFRHYGVQVELIPSSIRTLMPVCGRMTAMVDSYAKSGEWKRHRVYAAMIKKFPEASRRDISKAIDLTLPPKEQA
jgi:hypothetical protein